MDKALSVQHPVTSSNLESVGFYQNMGGHTGTIRVKFQTGAVYDYTPCTEEFFQSLFKENAVVKDWFNKLKANHTAKKV
jgi:hypothetical protein